MRMYYSYRPESGHTYRGLSIGPGGLLLLWAGRLLLAGMVLGWPLGLPIGWPRWVLWALWLAAVAGGWLAHKAQHPGRPTSAKPGHGPRDWTPAP